MKTKHEPLHPSPIYWFHTLAIPEQRIDMQVLPFELGIVPIRKEMNLRNNCFYSIHSCFCTQGFRLSNVLNNILCAPLYSLGGKWPIQNPSQDPLQNFIILDTISLAGTVWSETFNLSLTLRNKFPKNLC